MANTFTSDELIRLDRPGRRAALAGLASIAVASQVRAQTDPALAIVEKARAEAKQGKFVNMVSSPKGERAHRAIMDAFHKRFDLQTQWEWLPLTSRVSAPRIVEQAKAKAVMPTVVGGYAYQTFDGWIAKNGIDTTVDWVGEFGQMFPTIRAAAIDGVLPAYRNKLLRQWDVKYVMVYNTDQVKPQDIPKSLEDLTQPKWRGRFAMSNNTPPPLDILALDIGKDKVLDLTRRLLANQPRFKAGPPAVVGSIASGEVAVGVAGYTALAEAERTKGAPVNWAPLDTLPVGPLFVFLPANSPQPNLGKLFLAWLVTEGQKLQEEQEFLSFFGNRASPTTGKIVAAKPGIKVVEVGSAADQALVDETGAEVMKLIASSGAR